MTFMRREVRSLGGNWNDTLLWYAKAVRALKQRPFTDPTSWWFLGAIHGFHPTVWTEFGFMTDTTALPAAAATQKFWEQCQHQTWYFLPWHRGYVYAFEEIVRAAIVAEGGPADWALPYWNYSDSARPDASTLPPEFSDETLPDGTDNPLFVERRWGDGAVPIVIDPDSVSLKALGDSEFSGGDSDIPPGFGGPETTFHHGPESQTTNGGLESLPHNNVHGAVGGSAPGENPNQWWNLGLMSMPITAALDPIFWLHHSNIDRLWSIWLGTGSNANPLDNAWRNGPADRGFVMPLSDGSEWSYVPREVLDTRAAPLDYAYDDENPVPVAPRIVTRMASLGVQAAAPDGTLRVEEIAVSSTRQPQLIGASDGAIAIQGATVARVALDATESAGLKAGIAAAAAGGAPSQEPARVFLKLDGIRGTADAAIYKVYLDLAASANPADYPDRLAGTVSLFGVSAASDPAGPAVGNGINQVFEITEIVDALHLSGDDLSHLDVRFIPGNEAAKGSDVTIRQLHVYRLGD